MRAFFSSKKVKVVCLILCVLSTAGLLIGGLTVESVNGIVVAVATAIAAVSALLAYIQGLLTNGGKE